MMDYWLAMTQHWIRNSHDNDIEMKRAVEEKKLH